MSSNPEYNSEKERRETQSTALYFPRDGSIDNQQTVISLYKYQRGNPRELPKKIQARNIFLPLPMSGIEDNISLKYAEVPLGAVGGLLTKAKTAGGYAAGLGLQAGQTLATSVLGAAGDVLSEAVIARAGGPSPPAGVSPPPPRAGAVSFAKRILSAGQTAAGQAKEALGQAAGLAENPNLSLSFEGVQLRTHAFSWRLIAKSADESSYIEAIINTLKINALPQKLFGAGFQLAYPSIAQINFYPTNLIKISDLGCFIESVNVKYDGDGYATFFNNNKPVIVDLSVTFRERAILTSDDYYDYNADALHPLGNGPGQFIGGRIGE